MTTRRISALMLTAVLALAGSTLAAAQEGDDAQAAMMEAWQKAATPAAHHKHMAKMVGDWNFEGTFWMAPGAPPVKSNGTATIVSILGGRYFQTTIDSMFMDEPFQGLGIDGYDNVTQKHVGSWFDTAGTMILNSEGSCEDGGRVTTTTAEMIDPMTGEQQKMKTVATVIDANKMRMESFIGDAKTMEIVYTRK